MGRTAGGHRAVEFSNAQALVQCQPDVDMRFEAQLRELLSDLSCEPGQPSQRAEFSNIIQFISVMLFVNGCKWM
jgi:hypothetical protein